jgi:SAM-dependent methyltransferase
MTQPNRELSTISRCRLCLSSTVLPAFELAPTPPANNLISPNELSQTDQLYPLRLLLCDACRHLQLQDIVNPELLFRDYLYVSGTSAVFVEHFREYFSALDTYFKPIHKPFVVEIGSNDGTLLQFFLENNYRILGIDPAQSLAEGASGRGITTIPSFFNKQLATKIVKEHDKADAIIANNVFAHIPDIRDFTEGVQLLLNSAGIFVFEVSYLVDVLENTLFDTIYHEHVSYHTLTPLVSFFAGFDLEIFDAHRVNTHGGSIRVFVQHKTSSRATSKRFEDLLLEERRKKLGDLSTYKEFFSQIEVCKLTVCEMVNNLKRSGQSIAGFGAPAKATTLLHHFSLGSNALDFIVDDNPLKQGKFIPGVRIPIVNRDKLKDACPDVLVILAWNFADSIIEQLGWYEKMGGKFLVPLPKPLFK